MDIPDYSYPPGLFPRVAWDVVFLRHRDFRDDAKACIDHLKPPVQIGGCENIPERGPCVLIVNHYHRAGFGAQWIALAIAALVPANMHWLMTGEFTYPGKWYQSMGAVGSRILLKRIAAVYGFTTMPPMPPREKDVEARAVSVRAVLDYVKRTKDPILGLAPEGHDAPGPEGVLTRPTHGVGRFGLLLSTMGLKFNPVGVYEADGVFHIHFGESYELAVPRQLSSDEKDRRASQLMMESIARLLPVPLRGEFA